jgi:signal peptidase II
MKIRRNMQIRDPKSPVLFFVLAFLIIALDQFTKYLLGTYVALGSGIVIIPGAFDLVHTRNPGAAFSIGSGFGWLFFVSITVVSLCVILWIVLSSRGAAMSLTAAYALFFGGAFGNLIDRVRFGEVVDFLDVHWGNLHWPAFNVADSALCVAAGLFLLHLLIDNKRQ